MEKRLAAILRLALDNRASDIHFTRHFSEITIEMRINNSMRKVKASPQDFKLIRYLQYLANLDIGNLSVPQTGQFEYLIDDETLSLRFAVINNVNFTNAVLRILNKCSSFDLNKLSSVAIQNDFMKELLIRDYGLILFSGPTGSGKTTSLYTLLDSVQDKKIYTIEDPIEVYNDKFVQLQINEKASFDYEQGIKQVLRHDPDIIMIGEIRDKKAAVNAVIAANTGHLVLSSIHASRADTVVSRLSELGVNESHLYEVLLAVFNQRLLYDYQQNRKRVIYEIMDKKELDYFHKYHKHSPDYLSLDEQLAKGVINGYFKTGQED